jgi:DNA-binding MarR family transcriptional regulator
MSISVSAWAWEQMCGSPAQKLVLIKLADSANDDGVCWPSLRTLERDLGMSKSAVDRNVKKLVEASLLTVEVRKHSDGRRRSNLYRLTPRTLSRLSGTTSEEVVPPERDNPRAGAPIEGKPKTLEERATPSRTIPSIDEVYNYWREQRNKARSTYDKISDARRKKLATRLGEFSVEDLKRAIDGVACDPWPDRANHDDITIIFRSHEQVEKFLDLAERGSAATVRGLRPEEIARRAIELGEEEAA